MHKFLYFLLLSHFISCAPQSSDTEIHQKERTNVLNVQDKVTEIDFGDVFLSDFAKPYIFGDYLIISDYKSFDKLIYIFDKKSFQYLASTGDRGQGPGEIVNMGDITVDETNRLFYVIDHGKRRIFAFELDSTLTNPDYLPQEKFVMGENFYPNHIYLGNDTLAVGLFVNQIGNSDYKPLVAKWNMRTDSIELMTYAGHPEVKRKRIDVAVSFENGIYVECYWHHDLMTIGGVNGDFKRNIYGSKWNNEYGNKDLYYGHIAITENRIIVSYLGSETYFMKEDGMMSAYYPDKFQVFDLEGNYIQTLDVGLEILNFCYDKDNHRLIMVLNDEKLVSYLDLEGVLE